MFLNRNAVKLADLLKFLNSLGFLLNITGEKEGKIVLYICIVTFVCHITSSVLLKLMLIRLSNLLARSLLLYHCFPLSL